jgi:hypothetical protein
LKSSLLSLPFVLDNTLLFTVFHRYIISHHVILTTHLSSTGTMGTVPASILSAEYWSDIDASSFRIRGRTYNQDKVKAASAPSIFKLIAIDVSRQLMLSSFRFHPRSNCITESMLTSPFNLNINFLQTYEKFPDRYSMFLSPPSTSPPTRTIVCLWPTKEGSRHGTALRGSKFSVIIYTCVLIRCTVCVVDFRSLSCERFTGLSLFSCF